MVCRNCGYTFSIWKYKDCPKCSGNERHEVIGEEASPSSPPSKISECQDDGFSDDQRQELAEMIKDASKSFGYEIPMPETHEEVQYLIKLVNNFNERMKGSQQKIRFARYVKPGQILTGSRPEQVIKVIEQVFYSYGLQNVVVDNRRMTIEGKEQMGMFPAFICPKYSASISTTGEGTLISVTTSRYDNLGVSDLCNAIIRSLS